MRIAAVTALAGSLLLFPSPSRAQTPVESVAGAWAAWAEVILGAWAASAAAISAALVVWAALTSVVVAALVVSVALISAVAAADVRRYGVKLLLPEAPIGGTGITPV
jgi:hypothetical protein